MKKILLTLLVCTSLNANAQYKKQNKTDKPGTIVMVAGCVAMSIGFLIPDGS